MERKEGFTQVVEENWAPGTQDLENSKVRTSSPGGFFMSYQRKGILFILSIVMVFDETLWLSGKKG